MYVYVGFLKIKKSAETWKNPCPYALRTTTTRAFTYFSFDLDSIIDGYMVNVKRFLQKIVDLYTIDKLYWIWYYICRNNRVIRFTYVRIQEERI